MEFIEEDELLQRIYKIKNINSIHVYDISNSSKNVLIPALLVFYTDDNGKSDYINLSYYDKYFDILTRKVTEVYNREKDNVKENKELDPFGFDKLIQIDQRSKDILESNALLDMNNKFNSYIDRDNYQESFFYQKDELNNIFSIIKYHLEEIGKHTTTDIKIENRYTGGRNRYCLYASIGGIDKILPIEFIKEDNDNYIIRINGLFDKFLVLNMKIRFNKDSINVNCYSDDNKLNLDYSYSVQDNKLQKREKFNLNGYLLHFLTKDLDKVDNPYKDLFNDDYELNYFRLPWDAYLGFKVIEKDLSDTKNDYNAKRIEIISTYLEELKDGIIKRDNYESTFKRNETTSFKTMSMSLGKNSKITTIKEIKGYEDYYLVEENFCDTNNGFYELYLSDKYFYSILVSKDLKKDNLRNAINIDKSMIRRRTDLGNNEKIKMIVGGNNNGSI